MEVGPGYYPIFPRIKNWHNVTVIEPLSECVQSLMRKFKNYQGVEFCEITLENYLLENQKTFDFISLVGVLHEIEDYEVIFEKISNLLTLNGILVVVIPNSDSLHRFAHRSIDEDDSEEHISNAYGNLIIRKNEILDLYHNFNFSNLYTSSFTLKPFTHELMHRLLSADSELLKNWIELNQNSEFTKKYGSELILIGQKQ